MFRLQDRRDAFTDASVFSSVFIWTCVWAVKESCLRSFYFLFFHKMLDTFSPMIFAAFIDTSISKRAERAASSNRVNLPIEMTSRLMQTLPYALLYYMKSYPSHLRAAVVMRLLKPMCWTKVEGNLNMKNNLEKQRSHTGCETP